tara:strand:- start:161 stop:775 length:615 start_codon:yes stop_codon:yes gene_type:complete
MSNWSDKYKKSIDCDNPKGFSQKAHCAGRKKSLKELREYMGVTYGVGVGPISTLNPMASMGGQGQLFPQYKGAQSSKQAGIYSQRTGPGLGTYKPMVTANTNRIPRKKGQPAGSDKHSDLYTDENPKGTIHGLGFTDKPKAKQSVSKIRGSGKTHAHKMQAAIAMGQRAKVASVRAKDPEKKKNLRQAYKVYQSYIDKNKKSKD